jgi:hypothetical protein
MKKSLLGIVLAIVAVLSTAAIQISNYSGANDHPVGFHFFHSIHLDDEAISTDQNRVVQPLMLSKGHDYDFVLKSTNSLVKVIIRDDQGKVLGTNFEDATQRYFTSMIFQCHISEFYQIEIVSSESEEGQCVVYSKSHE